MSTETDPKASIEPRKIRQGLVVSDARDKTITIELTSSKAHPVYGKTVRRTTKLHVHDEDNDANVGDFVKIVECRPLSRQKRWRLVEILERAR